MMVAREGGTPRKRGLFWNRPFAAVACVMGLLPGEPPPKGRIRPATASGGVGAK